ncbi:MAG: 16S rRNA processing protein RimM [Deltaproteobacteria bacterium]|nr:16S rRNA processing protein RimM [Deltaproteobacteria bacterium]
MRPLKNVDSVEIGRVVGVHGIKGEIKVLLYGSLPEFRWDSVFLDGAGKGRLRRSFRVLNVRGHKNILIFALDGCRDRDFAGTLVGMEVSVRRDEIPAPAQDEYYHHDLIGMEVASEDGRQLGRITGIISTGSNDVFEVDGPYGEVLVPVIEQTAVTVDLKNKKVVVRLLDGLLPEEGQGR